MIVYHGTSSSNLPGLITNGPETRTRSSDPGCKGLEGFSTTEDFDIAALFAMRRSPPHIAQGNYSGSGVVLEYALHGDGGMGWRHAHEPTVLQDEKEIFVYAVRLLELVAIHQLDEDGKWTRYDANVEIAVSVTMSFAINMGMMPQAVFEALPIAEQRRICAPHIECWLASAGDGDTEQGIIEALSFAEPANSLAVIDERPLETNDDGEEKEEDQG